MEVLSTYITDPSETQLPLKKKKSDTDTDTDFGSCNSSPIANIAQENSKNVINIDNDDVLCYIINCYHRVFLEERRFPKKSSVPPLSDVLADIRSQLISVIILYFQTPCILNSPGSILLDPLLNYSFPDGFLQQLVSETFLKDECFSMIFSPLLKDLYKKMKEVSLLKDEHRPILEGLNYLLGLGWKSYPNVRPIATLIVQQSIFFPEMYTESPGREIARTTFFSPFLNVSIFAEDSPELADKYFASGAPDKTIVTTLQQELENTRTLLHKIFHSVLVNTASRDLVLDYLGAILNFNEKRSQMQSIERQLATDGFMLNVLVLLQQLSVRIQLEKVDFMYIFDPNCIVDINDTTRLKLTTNEYCDWIVSISKCR